VKEQKRLRMMVELDAGRVTGQETAQVLGLSVRQVWRLLAAFRREGAAGLMHGNRGREPANKTQRSTRERIQELARGQYRDYNDTHFTEELEKKHQIVVSRSTSRCTPRMEPTPPRQHKSASPTLGGQSTPPC
jgi:biotin operon repressor